MTGCNNATSLLGGAGWKWPQVDASGKFDCDLPEACKETVDPAVPIR